jgi:hypothetical protein
MHVVKIKLLEDVDIGKNGEIVNTTEKETDEIRKIMEEKNVDREQAWKILKNRDEDKYIEEQHKKKKLEIAPDKKTAKELNKSVSSTSQQTKTEPKTSTTRTSRNNNMIQEEEIREPVIFEGAPQWLIVKQQEVVQDSGRDTKDVAKDPLPSKTVTEFILRKPGLWQCQKCACIIESNPDEPAMCYEERGGCGRKSTFRKITDTIDMDLWKLPIWEDISAEDLDMLGIYDDALTLIKKILILPEEIHYKIFTLWIISTWKTGHWSSVGFPIFRGEYNTGKTTALDIIRELGYRMIHSAGTTFPAMVRATHYHHAGLLIDEASDRLNPKTESGREMLNFVKPSYRIGSRYTAADKEDPKKINSYKNFGFKSFAGERNFDLALLSRSVDFVMQEDYPEIPNLKYVKNKLDKIQTELLNYRYKTDAPPDLGIDFVLKGRMREVFESIIATGNHIGEDVEDIIQYAKNLIKEREEELQGTIEYDILTAIRKLSYEDTQSKITEENDAPEYLPYKDIFEKIHPNHAEMDEKERNRKSARLGYIFKKLILKTKRLGIGTVLVLNDAKNHRRLNYLYKKYKVGGMNHQ